MVSASPSSADMMTTSPGVDAERELVGHRRAGRHPGGEVGGHRRLADRRVAVEHDDLADRRRPGHSQRDALGLDVGEALDDLAALACRRLLRARARRRVVDAELAKDIVQACPDIGEVRTCPTPWDLPGEQVA